MDPVATSTLPVPGLLLAGSVAALAAADAVGNAAHGNQPS